MSDERESRIVSVGPSRDAFRGRSRVERALLPFLREPTLWPILAVLVVHVVAFVAPVMAVVWREPELGWPLVGLAVLAGASVAACRVEMRDRQRPGPVAGLIGATWLLCGAGAWAGARVGLL